MPEMAKKGVGGEGLFFIEFCDIFLVQFGEAVVPADGIAAGGQVCRDGVHHDRMPVYFCSADQAGVVLVEDLGVYLFFAPAVGLFIIFIDFWFVPGDACVGAFVFVDTGEGVAELMENDPAVFQVIGCGGQPAQVHGGVFLCDAEDLGADKGPGAVVLVEGDADVGGFFAGFEIQFDIGIFHPLFSVTDDAVDDCLITMEEGDIEDPGLFPDLAGLRGDLADMAEVFRFFYDILKDIVFHDSHAEVAGVCGHVAGVLQDRILGIFDQEVVGGAAFAAVVDLGEVHD